MWENDATQKIADNGGKVRQRFSAFQELGIMTAAVVALIKSGALVPVAGWLVLSDLQAN